LGSKIPTDEFPDVLPEFFEQNQHDEGRDMFKHITTTPPPAILQVCHESRLQGLKHYQLSFSRYVVVGITNFVESMPDDSRFTPLIFLKSAYPALEEQRRLLPITMPAHIYVNFETDIIFPMWEFLDDLLPALPRGPIQKIAFHTWNSRLDQEYVDEFKNQNSVKEILLYGTYFDLSISNHLQRVQFEELEAESSGFTSSDPDSMGKKLKEWEETFDEFPTQLQENFEEEQVRVREKGGNPEDVKLLKWQRPVLKPIRLLKTWQ
jgi:hypothetical protein